jgi:hypothetical protein
LPAVAVALAIVLGGCGEGSEAPSAPRTLTAGEHARVTAARASIRSYCASVRDYLTGEGSAPPTSVARRALGSVDLLAALAQSHPEAHYDSYETMREVLGDTAEDLEGTNCSATLVHRLERALAALPPER